MTNYVLVGIEYQKQYVSWDGFEKLHTIQTSPLLFYKHNDGDKRITCVSDDVEFMQDQAKRCNSGNFKEKYSTYEGASWIDWAVGELDSFDEADVRRGYE